MESYMDNKIRFNVLIIEENISNIHDLIIKVFVVIYKIYFMFPSSWVNNLLLS